MNISIKMFLKKLEVTTKIFFKKKRTRSRLPSSRRMSSQNSIL